MLDINDIALLDRVRESGEQRVPVMILIAHDTPGTIASARSIWVPISICANLSIRWKLEAAARALRQRSSIYTTPPWTLGELTIDYSTGQTHVGGQALNLRGHEWAVLEMPATRAGKVVSREAIANVVGTDASIEPHGIHGLVPRLQKKIWAIRTVRGVGYILSKH
jgi:DNA-binding response OmpR family regulator